MQLYNQFFHATKHIGASPISVWLRTEDQIHTKHFPVLRQEIATAVVHSTNHSTDVFREKKKLRKLFSVTSSHFI